MRSLGLPLSPVDLDGVLDRIELAQDEVDRKTGNACVGMALDCEVEQPRKEHVGENRAEVPSKESKDEKSFTNFTIFPPCLRRSNPYRSSG
jgi:hypothetical protein